jgi:hypothetical protein
MSTVKPGIDEARLERITRGPLPGSRKIYVAGTFHPSLRVPMREIHQAPSRTSRRSFFGVVGSSIRMCERRSLPWRRWA